MNVYIQRKNEPKLQCAILHQLLPVMGPQVWQHDDADGASSILYSINFVTTEI